MPGITINWPAKESSLNNPQFKYKQIQKGKSPNHTLFHGSALGTTLYFLSHNVKFDLIYIDPPFGTGKTFSTDKFTGYKDKNIEDLLSMLFPVLKRLPDLLKKKGNIFIHLDHRAVWAVKLLLDEIFGSSSFQNQIVWHYRSGGRATKRYSRKHDIILWYSNDKNPIFNPEFASISRNECPLCGNLKKKNNHLKIVTDENGIKKSVIKSHGKLYYYNLNDKVPVSDVWLDIPHLHQLDPERYGYPTQKPLSLLNRIISTHSPENGNVLDLFAGSGTTLMAAQMLGRSWTGSDISLEAINLIKKRLSGSDPPTIFSIKQI